MPSRTKKRKKFAKCDKCRKALKSPNSFAAVYVDDKAKKQDLCISCALKLVVKIFG